VNGEQGDEERQEDDGGDDRAEDGLLELAGRAPDIARGSLLDVREIDHGNDSEEKHDEGQLKDPERTLLHIFRPIIAQQGRLAISRESATALVENTVKGDYTEGHIMGREVAMSVELSREEQELVASLLEREFEEVRSEIHHTKSHDYKDILKEREKLVQSLLARLKS
jgi:hypothetical protein